MPHEQGVHLQDRRSPEPKIEKNVLNRFGFQSPCFFEKHGLFLLRAGCGDDGFPATWLSYITKWAGEDRFIGLFKYVNIYAF